ncbi:hypothetical protein FACS189435_3880 [Bacteroidia bacterium]|nr:hypothetical protein FACS189435_3880 [Bacteroidia bacterium]
MDIWDKKKRSDVMSKIRSKDTNPELMLRKVLFKKGYRYRVNYKSLPGKPDIVLPKYKAAIFVHGCFWHGHEGCKMAHIPKSNVDYWEDKISKNKVRDISNKEKLLSLGWKVITVWECEISKQKMPALVDSIIETLHSSAQVPYGAKIRLYEEINNEVMKVAEDIVIYTKSTQQQKE